MEKNKTSLTISQALKLYNGSSGLIKMPLQWSAIIVAIYIGTLVFFTLLIGIQNGFSDVREDVIGIPMSSMFLAMDGGIVVAVISVFTYEKNLPGGKFFRSVKGGFDTYKKIRTALELSTVIVICLFTGIICTINAFIPIMIYGTATCVSVAVFLLLGIAIANLINMIKNGLTRSVLNIIILSSLSFVGVFTVYFGDGKLGMVQIIVAIFAIVLIPISHKLMLTNYRKYRWDN